MSREARAYRAISNGVEIDRLAVVGGTVPDNFEAVGVGGRDDGDVTLFEVLLLVLVEHLWRLGDGT